MLKKRNGILTQKGIGETLSPMLRGDSRFSLSDGFSRRDTKSIITFGNFEEGVKTIIDFCNKEGVCFSLFKPHKDVVEIIFPAINTKIRGEVSIVSVDQKYFNNGERSDYKNWDLLKLVVRFNVNGVKKQKTYEVSRFCFLGVIYSFTLRLSHGQKIKLGKVIIEENPDDDYKWLINKAIGIIKNELTAKYTDNQIKLI